MHNPWADHILDLAIVALYLAMVIRLGLRRAGQAKTEDDYFLAGRRLGKFYQYFLNFGNSTDANSAVSVCSLVYQQGVSGVWLSFQTVFMNPYYWFMNVWFRRVRLVTTADLFEDRFGSRALGVLYVISQLFMAVTMIGFANYIGFKILASLLADVPLTNPIVFYLIYTTIVGSYLIPSGMSGFALNEVFQGCMIMLFSALLIPFGFFHLGGVRVLVHRVPQHFLELFGSHPGATFTLPAVAAILFVSLVQINAMMSNMGISGSAKDEYSARFGSAAGTYAKRIMIILWAVTGLLAAAIFSGEASLRDPDGSWGALSRAILAPGFLGLMMAGILAGNMSMISNQALATSALVVRNLYRRARPETTASSAIFAGKLTITVVLVLGVVAASAMHSVASILETILLVNVPFGAAIFLLFFWRRLTAAAVWSGVLAYIVITLILPALIPGAPGQNRFAVEIFLLGRAGLLFSDNEPGTALAARFFFDALLPFAIMFVVSFVTKAPDRERLDRFFAKMRTPVAASPAEDALQMQMSLAKPDRFDHLKLLPSSSWEFTKWTRTDALGFFSCCALSAAIFGGFWLLLRLLSRS